MDSFSANGRQQQWSSPAVEQGARPSGFRNMLAWQEAQDFADRIVRLVAKLPRNRSADSIGNQLVRAAGSIAANIAEGFGRFSQPAYRNHLSIARGSAYEAESWLDLLIRTEMITKDIGNDLLKQCDYIERLITTRMKALGEAKSSYVREEGEPYEA
jgi:four helix bundle protein